MKNYNYVYELLLKDGTKYIGSRSCSCPIEEDDYFGSASDPFVCKENVVKKEIIVLFTTRKEANEFERHLHELYEVDKNPSYRNRVIAPSADCTGRPRTEKQREAALKNGRTFLGKPISAETRAKMSAARLGKKFSPEHIENVSNARRGTRYKTNNSGFVGVHYHTKTEKWQAAINFKKIRYYLGLYPSASAASKAYEKAHQILKKTGKLDDKFVRNYQNEPN